MNTATPESMDILEIQRYLPHRYPMLFVDRVTAVVGGDYIEGIKNVSYNEEIFQGHFPSQPILPGVTIIEALAQVSGILGFKTAGKFPHDGLLYLFAGIDKVRFKRQVVPGDQLVLSSKLQSQKKHIWKFDVKATVESDLVASGLLTCAIIGVT